MCMYIYTYIHIHTYIHTPTTLYISPLLPFPTMQKALRTLQSLEVGVGVAREGGMLGPMSDG